MTKSDVIRDIEVKVIELPLKKQWKIALYAAKTRPHAVVRIRTENGVVGYGEVSPSPAFMGETGYTAELAINKYLAQAIRGADIYDLETIHAKMNSAIYGNYAAKSAVDIAIHDCIGKTLGVPVYKLLGGAARKSAELSWVVGMQDVEGSIAEAKHYVGLGYKVIKIKVGISPEQDYRVVKGIREALGDAVALRLDANQGYDFRTAVEVFSRIEQFNLESIEQPVRRWDIEGMKYVRSRLKTPIMADESVSSLHEVMTVIREQAADLVNLKVGKVGGLHIAKKIAAALEIAGMTATAGSNLEVGIGSAASVHFVLSADNLSVPHDMMIGGPLHEYDLITSGLTVTNGMVSCSEAPGLGVEVDDTAIFDKAGR
ncbi:L-Ala-D/L-Glu epimerase [Sporomusa rhizae]|uniref:mandelate racemase/muconate lactonizing enzyme family protein n=1 Tax=Sporomusa rhizae TaxID=357999 RepID=UPI00352A1821